MFTGVACGLCCGLLKFFVFIGLLVVMVIFAPFFMDFSPTSYRIPLPYIYNDLFKDNNLLNNLTKLAPGEVVGPQSVVFNKGDIFAGTQNGRIVRVRSNKTDMLAAINGECDAMTDPGAFSCGRPLGMRVDSKGSLFFIEPFRGLFTLKGSLQVGDAGQVKLINLIKPNQIRVGCRKTSYLHDLTIEERTGNRGHVVYMSDISGKWDFNGRKFADFEPETEGRILRYDVMNNNVSELTSGLWTPKGIEINDARDWLIVAESAKRTISKVHLKGPKAGKAEALIEFLPGEPEMVRRSMSRAETYWITFPFGRTESNPNWMDYLTEFPTIRTILARMTSLTGSSIESVGKIANFKSLVDQGFEMKNGNTGLMDTLNGGRPIVIEMDNQGQILNALQGSRETLGHLTQVTEIPGPTGFRRLLLSSYDNDYIGRVDFKVKNEN
ncbi:Adipocyte plasma membrane-associated protein [Halotydeus destructor]|nr:Adipocyte plasma membrane-associated protein [Halotydeus destructor]